MTRHVVPIAFAIAADGGLSSVTGHPTSVHVMVDPGTASEPGTSLRTGGGECDEVADADDGERADQ